MTIEENDVVYEYNKQNSFVNTSLKNKRVVVQYQHVYDIARKEK